MDIKKMRRKLVNNKANGPNDEVVGELFKYAGYSMDDALSSLFNQVVDNCDIPKYWGLCVLVQLHKKGDQTLPDNYTEGVSNTQRYKMLGNGFTCAVIVY